MIPHAVIPHAVIPHAVIRGWASLGASGLSVRVTRYLRDGGKIIEFLSTVNTSSDTVDTPGVESPCLRD